MSIRFAIFTVLILSATLAGAILSDGGNLWFAVCGAWLACLAGIIGMLDGEINGGSGSRHEGHSG